MVIRNGKSCDEMKQNDTFRRSYFKKLIDLDIFDNYAISTEQLQDRIEKVKSINNIIFLSGIARTATDEEVRKVAYRKIKSEKVLAKMFIDCLPGEFYKYPEIDTMMRELLKNKEILLTVAKTADSQSVSEIASQIINNKKDQFWCKYCKSFQDIFRGGVYGPDKCDKCHRQYHGYP